MNFPDRKFMPLSILTAFLQVVFINKLRLIYNINHLWASTGNSLLIHSAPQSPIRIVTVHVHIKASMLVIPSGPQKTPSSMCCYPSPMLWSLDSIPVAWRPTMKREILIQSLFRIAYYSMDKKKYKIRQVCNHYAASIPEVPKEVPVHMPLI